MKKNILRISAFFLALSLINSVSAYSMHADSAGYLINAASENSSRIEYGTSDYKLYYSVSGNEAVIEDFSYESYYESDFDTPVLSELVIPEKIDGFTVTGIADEALHGALYSKLTLPETIRHIGSHSLGRYSDAPSVFSLPDSLETIGSQIFSYNYPKEIIIPASVNSIDECPFDNTEVRKINISEDNTHYHMDNGALITNDGTELILFLNSYSKTADKYQIPEGVKKIGTHAFNNCEISNVLLPDSLEEIGSSAFYQSSIEKITIPSKVKTISSYTFFECNSLTDVKLNAVETIEESAFHGGHAIVNIDFGSSLNRIGYNAFCSAFDWNKKNAEILIPETVTEIDTGAFGLFHGSAFKVDDNNKYFASKDGILYNKNYSKIIQCPVNAKITSFVVPETVTSIGNSAFCFVRSLRNIEFPDSLEDIEDSAFEDCDVLETVIIPEKITRISDYAFWSCDSLSKIILPEGLESIGIQAFDNTAVTELNLPKSLKSVGEEAFFNCSDLKKVTLYPQLRNIHFNAFNDKTDISYVTDDKTTEADGVLFSKDKTVLLSFPVTRKNYNGIEYTVPYGVKEIASGAFENTGITRINIPDSVEKIGDGAFKNCFSLLNINYGNKPVSMGAEVFYGCSRLYSTKLPYGTEVIESGTFTECTGIHSARIPDGVKEICKNSMPPELIEVYIPSDVSKIDPSAFNLKTLKRICGEKNSYAQTFAEKNGIEFITDKSDRKSDIDADINKDGKVNIADLITIKAFLTGDSTVKLTSADANGDGKSNAVDLLCVNQILFGINSSTGIKDAAIIIDDNIKTYLRSDYIPQIIKEPSQLYDFFKTHYPDDEQYCHTLTDKYSNLLADNVLYCRMLSSLDFNPQIELYLPDSMNIIFTDLVPYNFLGNDDHSTLDKLVIVSLPRNVYPQDITAEYTAIQRNV